HSLRRPSAGRARLGGHDGGFGLARLTRRDRPHRARWRALARLERADVSDDLPAVLDGNLGGIRRHLADAVGDRVEQVPVRADADVGLVDGLDQELLADLARSDAHRALARAIPPVAGGAVDVEALLAAFEERLVDLELFREAVDERHGRLGRGAAGRRDFVAAVEVVVLLEAAA